MQPNYTLLVLLLYLSKFCFSQPAPADSSTPGQKVPQALAYYYSFMGHELPLYNGTAHQEYDIKTEGNAYWNTYNWQTGWIMYDKVPYYNVPLKYDLVKDVVIVQRFDAVNKIELVQERVDSFYLGGHTYIKLLKNNNNNLPLSGYYDLLAKGPLTLLARRTKAFEEKIKDMNLIKSVVQKDAYYVQQNGAYYSIKNSNDLLRYTNEYKKELQQYLKQRGLKYKRAPELTLVTIAQYFNQKQN